MNGTTETVQEFVPAKKNMLPRLRTVSWQEEVGEADLEIPGTPKTPRTSTTPGRCL